MKSEKPSRIVPARAMESAREFGRSGQATRLLLTAFAKVLKEHKEPHQGGRLCARMLKVIQTDPINGRGERTAAAGDISLLYGFDFFPKKPLQRLLYVPFQGSIDRTSGLCTVKVNAFNAYSDIGYQSSYTHLVFTAGVAALDFDRETYVGDIVRSDFLDKERVWEVTLEPTLPPFSQLPIVLVLGLQFYQVVNGLAYIMGGNGHLSLQVIQTDNGPR